MISIGLEENNLYILVEGRGTAEYCSELDSYIQEILSNVEIEHIYFDTKNAEYLDSSFIGIILSMKKKIKSGASLLNPNDKIIEIFQIMGLDTFVPAVYDENLSCSKCNISVNKKTENSIADIKLLLESHRNIMETSSENHKRFVLVEKVFQKELEQRQHSN